MTRKLLSILVAVLMVMASELYDESDYIRDYDEFLAMTRNKIEVGKDE